MTVEGGALVLLAYFLGSTPFGLLLVRRSRRRDIRALGSGNIGAANVLRETGSRLAAATLALDAGKGVLAVLVARAVAGTALVAEAAALAAAVGHVYSPWLRLRGGKGVATACGGFGVLHPVPMLGALAVFVSVVRFSRLVSAGSLAAAAAFPAFELWRGVRRAEVAFALAAVALILWTHRENMARLVRGEEARIGPRPAAQGSASEET